jgi:hypothetical protein
LAPTREVGAYARVGTYGTFKKLAARATMLAHQIGTSCPEIKPMISSYVSLSNFCHKHCKIHEKVEILFQRSF